jgi:serine/threonine protein kinase
MAEVFAARTKSEVGFRKLVALKRMLPDLADDDDFVTMFLDEGRTAADISSPHVVSTLDRGRAKDDSLYLVMELVVGVSLEALMESLAAAGQRIPTPIARRILLDVALGLSDAHETTTPTGVLCS